MSNVPHDVSQTKRPQRTLNQSAKLDQVVYEIRGPVLDRANELAAQGREILRLNTGNPGIFDFPVPEPILTYLHETLPKAHPYSDSKGINLAREAVVARYNAIEGFPTFTINDVYLGNGASELITMSLQALLDPGDEVLIPAPDYPLWTASTNLAGGKAVHYLCDENDNWNPSLEDIRSKISDKTKAILVINPNNPTGAVYSREILEGIADIAREHDLLIFSDEIYDRILFDGAEFSSMAQLAPDCLVFTFNGLSKAYRLCGYRAGWLVITGPREHAEGFLAGVNLLASTRLCSNVPGQYAIKASLEMDQDVYDLCQPGGRLYEQRTAVWEGLNKMDGVSCVKPMGAMYAFAKLDADRFHITDDRQLCFDLVDKAGILVTGGTGFNYPKPGYLRFVNLPKVDQINAALDRMAEFLTDYRQ